MLTGRIWLFPQGMLTLCFSPRPVGNMEVALPPPLPWAGGTRLAPCIIFSSKATSGNTLEGYEWVHPTCEKPGATYGEAIERGKGAARIKLFCGRGSGRAARPSQPREARQLGCTPQAAACTSEAAEIINTL